jgi:CheY-like chemotaxis protein
MGYPKMKTILYVEDFPELLQSTTFLLEEKGYIVIPFSDSTQAEQEIKEGLNYDIAIFDLSLRKVDGNELTRISKEINPKTPVITISGYEYQPKDSNLHIIKGFSNHYLFKGLEDLIK